jgi:phosphotransferase system enzyme I (PtsI)
MIEVPSAVITSDALAKECDFLSIGTNDLVQYLLAVDRDNESISSYYKSCHPSVLKAIKQTVDNAHAKGIKVAVCGEMASDTQFVKLLLGLGVDELSVSPGRILMTKNEIINCHVQKWAELAEELMELKNSDEICEKLNERKKYE